MPQAIIWVPLVAGLFVLLCLWGSMRAARRRRLMAGIPTCKTTGVFIGLVELKGAAEAERPLRSYLAEIPCVYYSFTIDEHWSRTVRETYTDSDGKTKTRTRRESGWKTVASDNHATTFYLRDDCGVIRVRPGGAKIEGRPVFQETCGRSDPLYYGKGPAGAVSDSDHRRRFVETAIPLHTPIYLVGPAREREDVVAPEVRHDENADLFMISTRTEEQIQSGLSWQFWLLGLLAVTLGVGGSLILAAMTNRSPEQLIGVHVVVGLVVLAAWLGGWLWMAYNSLVDLRQRVRQAWANVDVQLKRRADLIPNLVHAVEGMRDHESTTQELLADLRAQTTATKPGDAGPDPSAVAPRLAMIVERYPTLTADASFRHLQQTLIDTENRIALARGYFNEIAAHYNTKLEVVPDSTVAALARLKPQPLLTANAFERAAVQVNLAEDTDEPPPPASRLPDVKDDEDAAVSAEDS